MFCVPCGEEVKTMAHESKPEPMELDPPETDKFQNSKPKPPINTQK